jgi:hypothetical protein
MWHQATSFAIPEKLTAQEVAWQKDTKDQLEDCAKEANAIRLRKQEPAALEWAKRITDNDIAVMEGKKPYNRQAPKEDIDKLKILKGHIQKGQFITKIRKVFTKGEMEADLEFVPARVNGKEDAIEYYSILPTSPP